MYMLTKGHRFRIYMKMKQFNGGNITQLIKYLPIKSDFLILGKSNNTHTHFQIGVDRDKCRGQNKGNADSGDFGCCYPTK